MLVKIANRFLFKCIAYWWPENILPNYSCFFFTLEKIKHRSNITASFDFNLASRRMIIYTAN